VEAQERKNQGRKKTRAYRWGGQRAKSSGPTELGGLQTTPNTQKTRKGLTGRTTRSHTRWAVTLRARATCRSAGDGGRRNAGEEAWMCVERPPRVAPSESGMAVSSRHRSAAHGRDPEPNRREPRQRPRSRALVSHWPVERPTQRPGSGGGCQRSYSLRWRPRGTWVDVTGHATEPAREVRREPLAWLRGRAPTRQERNCCYEHLDPIGMTEDGHQDVPRADLRASSVRTSLAGPIPRPP
jgi:hypothetical protein